MTHKAALLDEVRVAIAGQPPAPPLDQLETPVPLVDVDIAERNIARWQAQCDRLGLANRPHIKTHKTVLFARRQLAHGAVGITCQKLGEAEVMADAGIEDILLTYNVLGAAKLARLVALCRRVQIAVVADSSIVAAGLSKAMAEAGLGLRVLVECDTGGGRCGVGSPEAAAQLAAEISALPNLRFGGWMTFPRPAGRPQSDAFLGTATALCRDRGLTVETVSTGGTPDMWAVNGLVSATEYRAGTYIYNDRARVERGICGLEDCAISVLATVVSRPSPLRAIIDAGSKSLSSDLIGLTGHGLVVGMPGATVPRLDEEHGYIQFAAPNTELVVGSRLRVIPNHACVVSNLADRVVLCRGTEVLGFSNVDARGRVT
jgi:D-serine deaminase-like pyridoxal phosphate-dependent protein